MSGMLALLFLIVTQREALDTTVSMAIGVTTAVPTLVKLASHAGAAGREGRLEGERVRSAPPTARHGFTHPTVREAP